MQALVVAGLAAAVPAAATVPAADSDQLSTYVTARAADALGDPARAAQLFANLSRERPGDMTIRRRAIVGAIAAGDMKLALQLGRSMPIAETPLDLRLLMVADELRRQADQFIDLANLQEEIGRDPAERAQRAERRRTEPEPLDEFESEDLIET